MLTVRVILTVLAGVFALASCGPPAQELTPDEIAFQKKSQENKILAQTVRKPGGAPFEKGKVGGTWLSSINDDPKTFNTLTARDGDSRQIVDVLYDSLLDYDAYTRTWKPNLASYEVATDEKSDTLTVTFTLRDDLYWDTLADPSHRVKITSDDVIFWYDEVAGDKALQLPDYPGQFIEMKDGTKKRITVEKLDDRRFAFHYPRIVAMPELSSNMDFGPKYIFEKVKKEKGVEGLLKLWSVDTDPKTIPSVGPYLIASYKPGISVVLKRNPGYWKKDAFGQSLPYIDTVETKIIPNQETEKLKFLAGEKDGYSLRPEDLDDLVKKTPRDYDVYYGGPSLGGAFITWNQNPKNLDPVHLKWFTQTKFRQAMSRFFDRDRVVSQVYRGLAEPALSFFARPNPFYNPAVVQKFTYDPDAGVALLGEIGIKRDAAGTMRDADGHAIEIDLNMGVEDTIPLDIGNIYADSLKKVGIKLNVKPIDFQKLVDKVVNTYDWQAVMVSLGSNYWPTSGSNVWQSSGNFHVWRPLQEKPATDWEARLDSLYQAGYVTRDHAAAQKIWDEFQTIILDQLPVMYMVLPDTFSAYRNKWGNMRVDNLQAPDQTYLYLKD
jgi:peptide/nickel transport system substrate-binding protein